MPDLYSKVMTAENEFKTSTTSQRLRLYHRAGFRIPRPDKNSGKSDKTGKLKYGQCIIANQNT